MMVALRLRPTLFLMLIVCGGLLAAVARAQQRPLDFTSEERALFVEAVRKPTLRPLAQFAAHGGAAAWIDADHLLYSTREIEGVWKANPNEPAKVIIIDVRTGAVQLTQYDGNLVCYSPARMLIAVPRFPNSSGFTPRSDRLFAARFGEPLQPVDDTVNKDILPSSCALNPVVTTLIDGTEVSEIPLRPGDGFLRIPRKGYQTAAGTLSGYELFDSSGRLVRSSRGNGHPLPTYLHYVPWLHAYFSDKATLSHSEYVWPDGRQSTVRPPPLLAAFSASHGVGAAAAIPVRPGVLWRFVAWRGFWRMQGLYLQPPEGKLQRLDAGHALPQPRPAVSPDGCEVFYFRREGDPLDPRTPIVPTSLNVCEGEYK